MAILEPPYHRSEPLMSKTVIQSLWGTCYFVLLGEANEEGNPSTTEAAMPNPEVKAPEAQEEEGAAASMAEASPEEEEGVEAGMAGPEDAESSAKAEEEENEVFVVVGTGEGVKASSWSPCKGRLLLIQLARSGCTQKGIVDANKGPLAACVNLGVCMAKCSFIESSVHVWDVRTDFLQLPSTQQR